MSMKIHERKREEVREREREREAAKLYNEKLQNLHSSQNITEMIKLKIMRRVRNIAHMGDYELQTTYERKV
jgi:hypothetical protein